MSGGEREKASQCPSCSLPFPHQTHRFLSLFHMSSYMREEEEKESECGRERERVCLSITPFSYQSCNKNYIVLLLPFGNKEQTKERRKLSLPFSHSLSSLSFSLPFTRKDRKESVVELTFIDFW